MHAPYAAHLSRGQLDAAAREPPLLQRGVQPRDALGALGVVWGGSGFIEVSADWGNWFNCVRQAQP